MWEIFRDKAGNRIVKEWDGRYAAYNGKGELVNFADFKILARRAGLKGEFRESNSNRFFRF